MRPFIVRQLQRARGAKPVDAARRSLRGAPRNSFETELTKNEGRLEAALDVGHFPWVIADRDNWQDCFSRPIPFGSRYSNDAPLNLRKPQPPSSSRHR